MADNNPDGLVGKFIVGMVATFGIWAACITALEVARVEIDRGFVTALSSNAVVVLGILGLGLRNEIRGRAVRLQLDRTNEMTEQAAVKAEEAKKEAAATRQDVANNTALTVDVQQTVSRMAGN